LRTVRSIMPRLQFKDLEFMHSKAQHEYLY